MNYVPALPPFSYAYSCKYNGTGCREIAMENVNTWNSTPTIDDLQNEMRNKALSEIAITCESISQGTAYDLTSKPNYENWITTGGVVMKNISYIHEDKYNEISKSFDSYTRIFSILIGMLALIAIVNPYFMPRPLSFIGIGMFLMGILGLRINKILWKENNKCLC